ncbi:hypothetical protein ACIBJE_05185 [Micromonospora sp. NPDC050187]|uniref:effector-associated constant component EACC1 n=1 Tax=Micromonospora sp. NPDC050187 TaxID=3364277 RepID=UPI0037A517E3
MNTRAKTSTLIQAIDGLGGPVPEQISPQVPEAATHGAEAGYELVLMVSEPADVGPLFRRLSAVPDTTVVRKRSGPGTGELGVSEVLQLLVPSSAVLAVVIRTLPAFIRSRRSSVTVTVNRKDRTVTITGSNVPDLEKIIESADYLLGDD